MRITRLELHGFKSFADRTVLHLGAGISCVVGPNGCGKSNVVDALKWVIGEQSAKSLRGDEMLDVIFAGSSDRKPVGYAEVGLVLSAEGGEPFPGDWARYAEVHVARRLYRSGVSEYLMNQTKVRRKDIVDLFMDTGVGNDLYSFIEQGRIDKIVGASTDEVRGLVDEAAGITRYKKRRDEAQSKLDSTGTQLDRAADVADEMGRRLKTLERQVVAAARFRRTRALLRQDEVQLALAKLSALSHGREDDAEVLVRSRRQLADLEGTLQAAQDGLALREQEAVVAGDTLELARDRLAEADARLRETTAAQALQAQRARDAQAEVGRLVEEAGAVEQRLASAGESVVRGEEEAGRIEARVGHATQAVVEAREAVAAREALAAGCRGSQAQREGEVSTRSAEVAILAARLEGLTARARELPERLEQAQVRLEAFRVQAEAAHKRGEVASSALLERRARRVALEAARVAAVERQQALERRDLLARDGVRSAEHELDAAQRALAEAIQRAETTAGQAEEEVAARVARVEQVQDTALREAERLDAAELDQVESAERSAIAQREVEGRAAVEGARRADEAALAGWRAETERALDAEEVARRAALEAELAEALAAIEAEAAAARAAARQVAEQARQRRDDAERRLAEATAAQQDVEARLAVALRRRRESEARIAALEAEQAARALQDEGSKAVRQALADPRPLVERVSLPEADRAWMAAALGERLWLPVADRAEVPKALAAARASGVGRFILHPGEELSRLLGGAAVVDSLDEAVAHHVRSGAAAVVRGTGERVDADGVLQVGTPKDAAAVMEALDRLAEARTLLEGQLAETTALDTALLSSRAKVEGARIAARKAASDLDVVEQHGRDATDAAFTARREELDRRGRAAREAHASWRASARAAFEAEATQRAAARDEADRTRRAHLDEALAALREVAGGRVELVRARLREASQTRREAAALELEGARAQAWEAVRASTADVAVLRERLKGEAGEASGRLAQVRQRAEHTGRELAGAREAVALAVREVAELDVVLTRLAAEQEAAATQVASVGERITTLEEEVLGLQASIEDVEGRRAETGAVLEAARGAEASARAVALAAREELEAAERALREARAGLLAAESELASAREVQAAWKASREGALEVVAEATERRAALRGRVAEAELRRAEGVRQAEEAEQERVAAEAERVVAGEAWDAARTRAAAVREARDELARQVRVQDQEVVRLRREVLNRETEAATVEQERTSLSARIEERYQLDLVALLHELREKDALVLVAGEEARAGLVLGERSIEPVEDRILRPEQLVDEELIKEVVQRSTDLRAQLGRIGEVNLGALDEYLELEARWKDLDGQRADLDASVRSIREAIAKINRTCRERFAETFERVDEAFRKSYPELVGGGEARLQLSQGEDLLEAGVEILVRPPGKRLQSLSLLSGGEKAMTAIALLLALFSVKPSPFCVLDEVDAPLDEANGARFNEMLKRMASSTQFLVVTHNRKTMECADTLYGITMPTPGCSALVSVRVD